MIDHCATNELLYELGLTFTRPRNLTFDRFQLFTVQQNPNENLETFFSILRELGSKAALENVEEDLIKDFFHRKDELYCDTNGTTIRGTHSSTSVILCIIERNWPGESKRNSQNWNDQVNAIAKNNTRSMQRPQQQRWRCG